MAVASDEDRKCSASLSPETGSSKSVTSKSFRSLFRRKKKPPRMREHCTSEDEPEYQHRHHGSHYHTVSGTSSVGHVIHDQFSRRYGGQARMRRAHCGQIRSHTDSVGDEDDDDVTNRPDMTSSRRLSGYFRWRSKSAHDDAEDDMDDRSRSGSASGTGGLGGSRVRHWIYSFKQRSRSDSAATSGVHETPRSRGSKFKVTPARSLSSNVENHNVIGPVQFSEMVRNRTNSDPCFEAWLKAKAAVNSRQSPECCSAIQGGASRSEPHQMLIWRDSKRGTKVFKLPRNCEERPTIEDLHDDGCEELKYTRLMDSHVCYDLIPHTSKLVVFDTQLTVKKAFFALVENNVHAAALWDSHKQDIVGMLTITDFIQILQKYYKSPQERMDEVEEHQIATWREVLCVTERPAARVDADDSLLTAIRKLREHHVHRVLVMDSDTGNAVHVLTQRNILEFLASRMYDLGLPSFISNTLEQLNIGTYHDIATVRLDTALIEVLNTFVSRNVSALPVVDDQRRVVDVYAKFDVIGLAEEKVYNNLDVTVETALKTRREDSEGVHTCKKSDTLLTIVSTILNSEVHVHRLVVVDDDNVVQGIVSLSDVLHYLVLAPLENLRAKLEAEQSVVSDVTSPLFDIDTDEGQGHLKDVSTADFPSSADDEPAAAMLAVDSRESGEADDSESRDLAMSPRDQVILLTLTDLEVITEGELLDVSRSSEVDDFQLEVDWQRKQHKPELEIAACALP